ncbi:uncharacterized protein RCO7_06211 [Rhynchosporium graminicola]|uniref:Uncharacterized protein n=2 Tax=Rhynchosporium TaxID=38037 RepID=A0A1E1MEC8_RHYSE|nr:uncharacterized protein RCO7_06211 [Rhynchosporium commune]CZT47463.1 uncharacterized protein RSE6_08025 [Rhynchosporium secalis]
MPVRPSYLNGSIATCLHTCTKLSARSGHRGRRREDLNGVLDGQL